MLPGARSENIRYVSISHRLAIGRLTKKSIARPLRNMVDILGKLSSAKYISKLDLSQVYHQIPLDPECKEVTVF